MEWVDFFFDFFFYADIFFSIEKNNCKMYPHFVDSNYDFLSTFFPFFFLSFFLSFFLIFFLSLTSNLIKPFQKKKQNFL